MTNDLFSSDGTVHNSLSTASFEISSRTRTSESAAEHLVNLTRLKQQEEWNNASCTENENNCVIGPLQTTSTVSQNSSEQPILVSTVPVEEIKSISITTTISEFEDEILTSPVTLTETSSITTSQVAEHSVLLEQSDSTEDSMKYQNDLPQQTTISNTPFESLTSSSLSHSQENTLVTEISQINTEKYSFGETNTSNQILNTSGNVYITIKNITLSDLSINEVTEKYTKNFKYDDSENEAQNTTSKSLTLTTIYDRNLSENSQITLSSSSSSNNYTPATTYVKNVSDSSQVTVVYDYYSSVKMSSNQTLQPLVEIYSSANNFHPFDNNSSDDGMFVTMKISRSINQTTTFKNAKENEPSISTTLPKGIATQDIQQKAFLFKHVNNLTNTQRNNMTIDIIFISLVDIVEWFHSYDSVFRRKIASLLTKRNGNQPFQAMNIVYVAPTPLKNEKYFCVNFMVQSTSHENVYENGETIVQMIKQNLSVLAQTLHLPIESVAVGYNDSGKCHKSTFTVEDKNWSIIVVLGIILIIAMAMILGLCVHKTKTETLSHEPWEEDVQEWSGTIHQGTGRYRSTPQLPITIPRQLHSIDENVSRVNLKGTSKEDNNPIVLNNSLENVLIHNEEKNHPDSSCGENNETYIEDTKL